MVSGDLTKITPQSSWGNSRKGIGGRFGEGVYTGQGRSGGGEKSVDPRNGAGGWSNVRYRERCRH